LPEALAARSEPMGGTGSSETLDSRNVVSTVGAMGVMDSHQAARAGVPDHVWEIGEMVDLLNTSLE
jgi:hypothetical protein